VRIAVSICNKRKSSGLDEPGVFLYEVDLATASVQPRRIRWPWRTRPRGVTGLAWMGDRILAAVQSRPARLLVLSKEFRVLARWKLETVRMPHSLLVAESGVLIASTGSDSIVWVDPSTGREEDYWRADVEGADRMHLNSLALRDGQVHYSAFGYKKRDLWADVDQGIVQSVRSETPAVAGLSHPHSLQVFDGEFHFTESAMSRIANGRGESLQLDKGYPRGMLITRDSLILGISKGRLRSESTGVELDREKMIGRYSDLCCIVEYRRTGPRLQDVEEVQRIDMSRRANEIYDLLPL